VTQDPDRPTEQTRPVGGDVAERLRQFTLLEPGSTFAGRYRIEARIGGGGAGEVYRALDELSGVRVAIKVLFPRGEDPHTLERLRRELRLVRGLTHPGIVRTHDIGEHGGLLYLVMDLLEGETLRARLQRGRLPLDDVPVVLGQVLEALAAAHAAGIVHRDVKPGNVMLIRNGEAAAKGSDGAGRAVLLDFGLARAGDEPGLTRTGAFLGTPEYVSPEQARGDKGVGPAADVYSAGIVLWEMLAGRPPFEGNSQVEILMAHAQRPLPSPRRALAGAPGWLRDLAAWMLEKDPARRPADAGAALAFLQRRRRASLGRRWAAAGRTRGGTARRRALAASALLLGGALAAAALLPVRLEIRNREVGRRSLLGFPLPSVSAPFPPVPSPPRVDPFRFLLGYGRVPTTPRDAPYMAVFNSLSGTLSPFAIAERDPLAATCGTVFPDLSCHYSVTRLVALPGAPNLGSAVFAAIFTHQIEYSNLLAVFDMAGRPLLWFPFAGAIQNPVVLPAEPGTGDPPLLLAPVEFHDLGQRLGLVAIPLLRNGGPLVGEAQAPPYDLPSHDMFPQKPRFVTFAPEGRYATISLEPAGRVRLDVHGGRSFTFDARSGVPLDGPDVPRDRTAWLAARRRLIELLEQAAGPDVNGRPDRGAPALESFAAEPELAPSQRGTALGFAAVLRRRAGDLDRALANTRAALAAEPAILGHRRLLVDLLARKGDWDAVSKALDSFGRKTLPEQELRGAAVAAALLLGRIPEATVLIRQSFGGTYQANERKPDNALFQSLLALEKGAAGEAEVLLTGIPWAADYSQVALAGAIAAALRDPADPEAVARWARAARAGCGVSVDAPLVAVDALVAARTGRPGPTQARLADALARQDAAGREHLVELLFARWAHRLADEAARVRTAPR
jgi:hypothetical protein